MAILTLKLCFRLFIVGSNSGSERYIVQLPINAIDQHPDFSNVTLFYSTENSVSKVSDASSLTSVTSNSGGTPGIGGFQLTPTPSFISDSSASFTSLVSYHLDPLIKTGIVEDQQYLIPIELT